MKKIHIIFRLLLAISLIAVIGCYYLPLWKIGLLAPQYPEGLRIYIWYNDIKGDIDIINGLNHYIGMKHIKAEMFPEFSYIKYVIAAFIIFGLIVVINGTQRWLKIFCLVILLGGITALADFYRWGYDYGHNLDPKAPIQVPGMAYQPPLLGYKDLLNFQALSMPASGGWIIIAVGFIAFLALFFEWFRNRKLNKTVLLIIPILFILNSCGKDKPEFYFGKENCEYCKMKMMDNKFGMAIQTDKGKVFKFDDFICLKNYMNSENPAIAKTYVVLFDNPGEVIEAGKTVYGKHERIKSPMSSGIGFFTTTASFNKLFDDKDSSGNYQELFK
ncbi:MAG: hypothetical protein H7296_05035 [Bacteroidia bacterium]|nr:hypothetical protein [Bacteroidia bacterium]